MWTNLFLCSALGHHLIRQWLVACSAPSPSLIKCVCLNINEYTLRNISQSAVQRAATGLLFYHEYHPTTSSMISATTNNHAPCWIWINYIVCSRPIYYKNRNIILLFAPIHDNFLLLFMCTYFCMSSVKWVHKSSQHKWICNLLRNKYISSARGMFITITPYCTNSYILLVPSSNSLGLQKCSLL